MGGVWLDLLRLVPIAGGALLAGMTAAVLRSYWRAGRASGAAGLLSRHVLLIALSYLLFAAAAVAEMAAHIERAFTWRLPVHGVATLLGVLAMVEILKFERRRVQCHVARKVVVEEHAVTEIDENGGGP